MDVSHCISPAYRPTPRLRGVGNLQFTMYNLTFNTPLSELSGRKILFVRFFYRKALIKLTGLSVFCVSATDTTDTGVSVGKPLYFFLLWAKTDTRDLKRKNISLICNGNNIDVVPKRLMQLPVHYYRDSSSDGFGLKFRGLWTGVQTALDWNLEPVKRNFRFGENIFSLW